jgi:hypothetical protein
MTDKMLEVLESVKKRDDISEIKKIEIIKRLVRDDLGKLLKTMKERK